MSGLGRCLIWTMKSLIHGVLLPMHCHPGGFHFRRVRTCVQGLSGYSIRQKKLVAVKTGKGKFI